LRFAQICPKQALKNTIFVNIKKRPKNGQVAKPFYFWQTVSKKAKWQPWRTHHTNERKTGEKEKKNDDIIKLRIWQLL